MHTTEKINHIEVKAPKANRSVAFGQFGTMLLLVAMAIQFALSGDMLDIVKQELAWAVGLNLVGLTILQAVGRRTTRFVTRDESGSRHLEGATIFASMFFFVVASGCILTSLALPELRHETALVYLLLLGTVLTVSFFSPHLAKKIFDKDKPITDPVLKPNQAYAKIG